jgi:phosphopantetheinyl transferase
MMRPDALCLLVARRADFPAAAIEPLLDLLPESQKNSIARNVRAQDRALRLLARGLLGWALARLAGVSLAQTLNALQSDAWGRPFLPGSPWDFSFSHSGELAVCLLGQKARHGRLGVDVEARRELTLPDIAPAFCPEEKNYLASRNSQTLIDLWARKEAALKAAGTGLLRDPASVNMLAANPLPDMPGLWLVKLPDIPLWADYSLALAVENGRAPLAARRATPQGLVDLPLFMGASMP